MAVISHAEKDAPTHLLSVNSYITNWIVAGPLPNPHSPAGSEQPLHREGFYRDFFASVGGEAHATPRIGTTIPFRAGIFFTSVVSHTHYVDFNKIYALADNAVAYAFTWLEVPVATTVFLHVGSDDGIRVWLDGEKIIDSYNERGWVPDEDRIQVTLTEGRHALLIKCDDLYGAWRFSLRFTDRATHYDIRAKDISSHLFYTLSPPTGTSDLIQITPYTSPVITDMPMRIIGTLVSADGSFTQRLDCAQNASIALNPRITERNRCRLKAEARGFPGITPKCDVTLYLREITTILATRKAAIENLLSSKNETFAEQHRGVLMWLLEEAYSLTANIENVAYDSRIHSVISQCDSIIESLLTNGNYLAHLRGTFTCAYISQVDKRPHPFKLTVPADYNPRIPTPLVIFLHDAGESFSSHFQEPPELSPYISLRIFGRGGNGGYVGLSAVDVNEARKYVQNYYTIDSARIYCLGSSMGGYGTLMNATAHPDLYAAIAALNSHSADAPLGNLRNLPTMLVHGDEDLIVPVQYSRAALESLRAEGCPVVYKELPGVGYRLHNAAALTSPIQWLLSHRGDSEPQDVIIDATLPAIKKAYWAHLHSRLSPREPAHIRARFFTQNELILSLDNVYHASFSLPDSYVDSSSLISVLVNGRQYEVPGPLPERLHLIFTNNNYTVARSPVNDTLRYSPGSWQKMYDGRPLIIVYGTRGNNRQNDAIRTSALRLSQWTYIARNSGSSYIPMYPDTEATDELLAAHNVILIGGVNENSITDKIADDLYTPLSENTILIGDAKKDISQSGLWLCQNSPFNPTNSIWLWTATRPEFYTTAYDWQKIWKFSAADPPDLLIYNCDSNSFTYSGHFNSKWKMAELSAPALDKYITNNTAFKKCIGTTLIDAAHADLAWIEPEMTSTFSFVHSLPPKSAAHLLFPRTTVISCVIDADTLSSLYSSYTNSLYIPETLIPAIDACTNSSYSIALLPRTLDSLNEATLSRLQNPSYNSALLTTIFTKNVKNITIFNKSNVIIFLNNVK